MKPEGHLRRAGELKNSLERLLPDPEGEHVAAIVELSYGIAQQLIAYGTEQRYGKHLNTHAGVARLLRRHGEEDVARAFERLDQLRIGRYYGGRPNGEVVRECLRKLKNIENWTKPLFQKGSTLQ